MFASADTKNIQKLVDAGLVDAPVTFAKNKLQIAVAAGNPKHITGLTDLAKPDVSVVLAAVGVPAGDYTRQVLAAENITVTPKSSETDVKSALAKVTSGEADATIVYVTDVSAGGPRSPAWPSPTPTSPTSPIRSRWSRPPRTTAAARAFVESAVSGDVQKALEAARFPPTEVGHATPRSASFPRSLRPERSRWSCFRSSVCSCAHPGHRSRPSCAATRRSPRCACRW